MSKFQTPFDMSLESYTNPVRGMALSYGTLSLTSSSDGTSPMIKVIRAPMGRHFIGPNCFQNSRTFFSDNTEHLPRYIKQEWLLGINYLEAVWKQYELRR